MNMIINGEEDPMILFQKLSFSSESRIDDTPRSEPTSTGADALAAYLDISGI